MPSITLSSAGVAVLNTDWNGAKTTTIGIYFVSSTSSAFFNTPMVTLDDPMRSSNPTWFQLSTVANSVFASSTHFDTPNIWSVLSPIAGVRVTSTNAGGLTMKILQNSGG